MADIAGALGSQRLTPPYTCRRACLACFAAENQWAGWARLSQGPSELAFWAWLLPPKVRGKL